jgi:hypothetical protein
MNPALAHAAGIVHELTCQATNALRKGNLEEAAEILGVLKTWTHALVEHCEPADSGVFERTLVGIGPEPAKRSS